VIQRKVETILDAYDVALLLVDTRWVDPAHLLETSSPYRLLHERGPLQLFERAVSASPSP